MRFKGDAVVVVFCEVHDAGVFSSDDAFFVNVEDVFFEGDFTGFVAAVFAPGLA